MTFAHPELLAPSVVGLVAVLYPVPWHIRTGNIATLSMAFWLISLNLLHIINCLIWSDNVDIKGKGWADFSCIIFVGGNFGLPLAHTLLAKQLESLTSVRMSSALYDENKRRRQHGVGLALSVTIPVIGILLHLSMMNRRFYIFESIGPFPATYWNTWAVLIMAIFPILLFATTCTLMIMAIMNINFRRQQIDSFLSSGSSLSKDQFYRLLLLAIVELGSCSIQAVWNLLSFENGPQPIGAPGGPEHSLTLIETVMWEDLPTLGQVCLKLQFFTVVTCSYAFFLCFCSATETRRFYLKVIRKIFPFIPESQFDRLAKLSSSIDSNRTNRTAHSDGYKVGGIKSTGTVTISMDEMIVTSPSDRKRPAVISINRSNGPSGSDSLSSNPCPSPNGISLESLQESPYTSSPYHEKRIDTSIA